MKITEWLKKLFKQKKKIIFPLNDQIEYQKPGKWQDWLIIDENIKHWKNKGKEISRLQSGWELGLFKTKTRKFIKIIYDGDKGIVELEEDKQAGFYLKFTTPTGDFVGGTGETLGEAIADIIESTAIGIATEAHVVSERTVDEINKELEESFNKDKRGI